MLGRACSGDLRVGAVHGDVDLGLELVVEEDPFSVPELVVFESPLWPLPWCVHLWEADSRRLLRVALEVGA